MGKTAEQQDRGHVRVVVEEAVGAKEHEREAGRPDPAARLGIGVGGCAPSISQPTAARAASPAAAPTMPVSASVWR